MSDRTTLSVEEMPDAVPETEKVVSSETNRAEPRIDFEHSNLFRPEVRGNVAVLPASWRDAWDETEEGEEGGEETEEGAEGGRP